MYEAKAAGYNQVQLAFGNKGLRFLLDDMSVNTYEKQAVTDAIKEGNKAYYNAGEKNELTEAEMNEILAVAKKSALKSFLFSIRLSIWKPLLRQWDSLIFKMHIMATIKLA